MKKHIFEAALAIGLAVSCIMGAFAQEMRDNISDKLIRLHVIANSDTEEDQELKLCVRDEIIGYISDLTRDCTDINEAREKITENIDVIKDIATNVVRENGFPYSATVELSEEFFPTKTYESFALPAGNYEALRIMLGEAKGQNWWCVLFPPVCISAAEATSEFQRAGMTESEIQLVTSDETQYRFKFKCIEIFESLANAF